MDPVTAIILVVTVVAIGWVTFLVFKPSPEDEDQPSDDTKDKTNAGKGKKKGPDGKKAGKVNKANKDEDPSKFTHPWLLSRLKAHTRNIIDIDLSPNGKYLASCAEDRVAYVWVVKDWTEKNPVRIQVNFPFDHSTLIRWSPDSKAFIVARHEMKMLEVYKLGRKPDNSIGNISAGIQFRQDAENAFDYIGLGIACNGKFIMGATKNGEVVLRDAKGTTLGKFYPKQDNPTLAKVSRCGRYVVVASHENMEIWEVKDTSGLVKEVSLKVQWKDKSVEGIVDFDMNADTTNLVAISTSGNYTVYDAKAGDRVFPETRGTCDRAQKGLSGVPMVTMTSDGKVVIIGANRGILFFCAFNGDLLDHIPNVFKEQIVRLACTADNKFLIAAGDNLMYVFRNIAWYQDSVKHLKDQLSDDKVTGALKIRLKDELNLLEEELSQFEED